MQTTSCRICFGESDLSDIFRDNEDIAGKILYSTSIRVTIDDGLPQQICGMCKTELDISVKFKEKCEEAHKYLNKRAKTNDTPTKEYGPLENIRNSTIKCTDCRVRFPSRDSLDTHIERKHLILCQICDTRFMNKKRLFQHLKYSHKIERSPPAYKCHICSKKIITSKVFHKHIQEHYNPKHLRCQMCNITFLTVDGFTKHMQRYSKINTYPCKICSKVFQHSSSFQTHMESHSPQFACTMCPSSFLTKRRLTYHLRSHKMKNDQSSIILHFQDLSECSNDSNAVNNYPLENGNVSSENIMQCELCEKMCWGLDELKQHVMMHMGEEEEKPYVCNLCGSSFRKSSTLKSHCKSHYVEKLNNAGAYYR